MHHTPLPGYPTTTPVLAVRSSRAVTRLSVVHQASFGYNQRANWAVCLKTTTFWEVKTDLSKLHIFRELTVKESRISTFCHFWPFWLKSAIFGVFLDTSGFWLFFTDFHRFGHVRFPNGNWRKVSKFTKKCRNSRKSVKKHENDENVTDRSDIWEMSKID